MKLKELIKELQEMLEEFPEADMKFETVDGCGGADDWFHTIHVEGGWDEKEVILSAQKGCMCVKGDRLTIPEAIKQNSEMKKAFFALRKSAFLSKLDRNEIMEMAVKFVGNQSND